MACADCHADQAAAFDTNPHRLIRTKKDGAAKANAQCESCHGDGAAHIEGGGDKEKIMVPRGRAGSDTTCLSCHDTSNDRISRHSGMHANSAAVNCLTCHSVHKSEPKSEHLLVESELALCSGCHSSQAATMRSKPYAHRIGRGGMECSSCHEPHGRAGKESLKQTAAGEVACMSCHSDKRGLYVFPHGANSVGDCMSCHESHGSSNARQLKRASVEQLCIECHSPIGGIGATATLASQPPSFHNLSMARYQNCTTCHVAIHGSNRSPLLLK
jgi:DmsE family decaheme c-type cytochrome